MNPRSFFAIAVIALTVSFCTDSRAQSKSNATSEKLNTRAGRSGHEYSMLGKQKLALHGADRAKAEGVVPLPPMDFHRKGGSRSVLQAPVIKASPALKTDSKPLLEN